MTPHSVSGPVSLSYVAALRGIMPRKPGAPFNYAVVNCRQPWLLMCLAASNPEGRFFGLMPDGPACIKAQEDTRARGADNVTFLYVRLADFEGREKLPLPPLNYLSADESEAPLTAPERAALFRFAEEALMPGGLFHYGYRAYDDESGPLRFLVREFGPEMNAVQAKAFLQELKDLGGHYFAGHTAAAIRLDDAIQRGIPDEFFGDYEDGEARSGSFETLVGLGPRGFSYAGDSRIAANYIDLSVSSAAADVILQSTKNFLYEPIKDFALNRVVRSDIWCREPAQRTADLADLFGGFVYGIVTPRDRVPREMRAPGKTVDLSSPLFAALADFMTLTPLSVGDFLAHPKGQGFAVGDVLNAVQTLVACGIAQPMRGMQLGGNFSSVAQPRFAGTFNRWLGRAEVSGNEAWFASPVLGGAVSVPVREALVMQALDKAGLANSVSALLPELERLARELGAPPTPEGAQNLIQDTVSRSIVQWYAYGLLEAA